MSTVSSIFSQVLKLIPRAIFDSAVHKHAAERNAKGFSSWGQLVAMLFCQLGSVNSLRDIVNGLAASEGQLRHLGLPSAPKRSTLAYANAHRRRCPFRHKARSPQVRTHSFTPRPPHLRHHGLVTRALRILARSPCPVALCIRFLFIGPQIRSTLPPHTRSPSCSCASLHLL